MPLPAPTTAPVNSVASTTSHAGETQHEQRKQCSEIAEAKDRTDAQIDAARNQGKAMPSATKPNSANSRISDSRLLVVP